MKTNVLDALKEYIEVRYNLQITLELGKQYADVKLSNTLSTDNITIVYNGASIDSYYEDETPQIMKQNLVLYAKLNVKKQDAIIWLNEFLQYILVFSYEDRLLGENKLQIINAYPIESDINTVFGININVL